MPEAALSSTAALAYRADIDGLRAVAVIAVLLFHAFPELLPGGFAGVDIFFVLSGYLISTIILHDLEHGRFSLAGFYSRRVRRIFPALSLVLATSLAAGWFLLLPGEWQALTAQVVAGAGFLSNALLARDAGYFDAAEHTKPLLHLWSLAIEEQFYIFWPLTLLFLWKRVSRILPAILFIALFSFVLDVRFLPHHPAGTFYSPATRMWELLAGAALARYAREYGPVKRATGEILGVAGALAIAVGFAVLNERTPFPGWWTLLPVLGTVSLVRAGSGAWISRSVLSSRSVVFIGLISYPLYLWHWPGLVFFRLVSDSDFSFSARQSVVVRILILALSIVLAWATWRFWEKPMRVPGQLSTGFRIRLLLGIMAAVACLAACGEAWVSPRLNLPPVLESARAEADSRSLPINLNGAWLSTFTVPSRGSHSTLLAGDSHMEQYWPRIESAIGADPLRNNAVFASGDGCPPFPGLNRPIAGYRCPELFDYWTALAMQERFTTVVLSAFWESYTVGYFTGFATTQRYPPVPLTIEGRALTPRDFDVAWQGLEAKLKGLVRSGKRVVIISSSASSFTFDPQFRLHRIRTRSQAPWRLQPVSRRELERFLAPVNARLLTIARNSGAEIINPLDYLCQGDVCPAVGSDGLPLYKDNNHLRASRVAGIATFIDDVLRP